MNNAHESPLTILHILYDELLKLIHLRVELLDKIDEFFVPELEVMYVRFRVEQAAFKVNIFLLNSLLVGQHRANEALVVLLHLIISQRFLPMDFEILLHFRWSLLF